MGLRSPGFALAGAALLASVCVAATGVTDLCPRADAARQAAAALSAPTTRAGPISTRRLPRIDVPAAVDAVAPSAVVGAMVFDRQTATPLLQLDA
ncbi:MAG: hypothetical protein ACRDQF_14245, partial [Thermocrispum sp.]